MGERLNLGHREALGKGVSHIPDAFRARLAEFFLDDLTVGGHLVHAIDAHLQATQGLLEGLLEGAAHGHDLAHRLHLGGEMAVGGWEFLKGEPGHLGHDIVDRWLEGGRRGPARDLVLKFIEGVAHGQLCRDLCNGKARGLGGQRRGPRHSGVHLDHDHPAIGRIDRELDVRAARVHTDLPQNRNRGIPHQLVFLVGEGLGGRHRDGVTGVNAHGVEVLDGADDDAVVCTVADHFHLELFPANKGFLDEEFTGGRGLQAALADGLELFGVVGDAAAGAAECEARANDHGKAHAASEFGNAPLHHPGLIHGVGNARLGRVQSNLGHGLLELEAVLGLLDGLLAGTNEFDLELLQHAVAGEVQGAVEGGLPTHGGQQGIGPLFLNDAGHHLPRDRLDVGGVGRAWVGHDRGRVAVDQDDPEAFLLQGLAGLRAGVVELTGLTDDDRARPDDENALDVGALRHGQPSWHRRSDRTGEGCRADRGSPRGGPESRRRAHLDGPGPEWIHRTARHG